MTYNVKSAASTLSWTDADATSAGGLTSICGTFTWTVTQTDGSAIDPIFTGTYTATTKTLSVQTDDFTKATTYTMWVKVQYTDWPTIFQTKEFTVDVKNPCLTDTLTISANKFAIPAMTYNVKTAASTLSWTDADVTSDGGF